MRRFFRDILYRETGCDCRRSFIGKGGDTMSLYEAMDLLLQLLALLVAFLGLLAQYKRS